MHSLLTHSSNTQCTHSSSILCTHSNNPSTLSSRVLFTHSLRPAAYSSPSRTLHSKGELRVVNVRDIQEFTLSLPMKSTLCLSCLHYSQPRTVSRVSAHQHTGRPASAAQQPPNLVSLIASISVLCLCHSQPRTVPRI